MITIKELLENRKSLEERVEELKALCPSLIDGNEVFYDKTSYIRLDDEGKLFTGDSSKVSMDTYVNMSFPCIFYLSSIYYAKDLAEKYKTNSKMKKNKSFSINENGLLEIKGYGVAGNLDIYREIIDEYEEDAQIVENVLNDIKETIEN